MLGRLSSFANILAYLWTHQIKKVLVEVTHLFQFFVSFLKIFFVHFLSEKFNDFFSLQISLVTKYLSESEIRLIIFRYRRFWQVQFLFYLPRHINTFLYLGNVCLSKCVMFTDKTDHFLKYINIENLTFECGDYVNDEKIAHEIESSDKKKYWSISY